MNKGAQTVDIRTVAFDADDTLWHNERVFALSQARFAELLGDYADPAHLDARLLAAERRNLGHYGFGIKGFVLSMIETALDVTDNRVPGAVIHQLVEMGREMLSHPTELLPHVAETVSALAGTCHLAVITKGDLLDQERKLAQSGLGDVFDRVEIVSDKTPDVYARIFAGCPGGAGAAVMVGNSVKSDVLPALAAGAWSVHIPHDLQWDLEKAELPLAHPRFRTVAHMGQLPDLLRQMV
ncbi:MAG: HAD family hydrolase [Roseivivax sp.]|nr:HAD family hydrolase [Roseivivax sp.]